MIKNFDATIKDILTGLDVEDVDGAGQGLGKSMTIRSAIIRALIGGTTDNVDGVEKLKRYNLAVYLNSDGDKDISVEQGALIKQLCGTRYTALVYGQIAATIDAN